ncbi:putative F-box/FBD/LRR-repeat protein At5g56810 isoform X2 [Lotus japonicus]|uniref:putative F-box/FBD/LRR-repeat protein At5g56810 isoform X2 n=1 Tax=Lotus japonicus TaxID=34305 RepID=UPI002582F8B0|nr:putative F-box/FBD/LRR-repeat protein At5g56810 isoform X2 [Lotus japonicus]
MESRNRKLLHSSTMDDDRISILPEELLCRILSFLPTKNAVATSVLAKKWKSLWRSLPTLDIDDCNISKEEHARFIESVNAFISSRLRFSRHRHRHHHQPIRKFRLRFSWLYCKDYTNAAACVKSAVNHLVKHRLVEHLDIALPLPWIFLPRRGVTANKTHMSPLIFTFTNLVVLKLEGLRFTSFSSVDFPFLKTLYLQDLLFENPQCLAKVLSGCPVLEDFKEVRIFIDGEVDLIEREYFTLPKLVRANVSGRYVFLLKAVKNVQFLHINEIDDRILYKVKSTNLSVFPMFHNLTHIELSFSCIKRENWLEAVELLKYCPQLQVLVINQPYIIGKIEGQLRDWQCPQSVPEYILLRLKRCYLNEYRGTRAEFQFARYIMQNGIFLENMAICCSYERHWPCVMNSVWRGGVGSRR